MSDDADPMELPFKMSQASRLMRLRRAERSKGGMDPTAGQGRVLAFLKIAGEASSADMAAILGVRQQSLNQSLIRLEEEGYVVREQAEDDRRRMIVRLTDKGRSAESPRNDAAKVFDVLTDEEKESLSRILDKLIEELSKDLGLPEDPDERMEAVRKRMGEERFRRAMMFHHGGMRCSVRHSMDISNKIRIGSAIGSCRGCRDRA